MINDAMFSLYCELKTPFPKAAMSVDNSRGFELTSIKAQYIIDRLNSVFTPFGWVLEGSYEDREEGTMYHGILKIDYIHKYKEGDEYHIEHAIKSIGFSGRKKNIGDMYKAAATDCLSKAASRLGIGDDVFKGNVDLKTLKDEPEKKEVKKDSTSYMANYHTTQTFTEIAVADYIFDWGLLKNRKLTNCSAEEVNGAIHWAKTNKKSTDRIKAKIPVMEKYIEQLKEEKKEKDNEENTSLFDDIKAEDIKTNDKYTTEKIPW